jgi:hypothetical protein
MKKSSTIFLQGVTVLIGICALGFMLGEPHFEGRNAQATLSEIYFNDPFLACAYIASIPFFVGLWNAFKLLQYAGENKIFSQAALKALRTIKYCATLLVASAVAGEAYLFIFQRGKDDITGGVFMGLLMIFISGTVAIAVGAFERVLHNGVNIKSENDLVV